MIIERSRPGVSLRQDYDKFLFTSLRRDTDSDFTILSVLASMGYDPWLTAEQLARTSKKQAAAKMSDILARSSFLAAGGDCRAEIASAVKHLPPSDRKLVRLFSKPHRLALAFFAFNSIALIAIIFMTLTFSPVGVDGSSNRRDRLKPSSASIDGPIPPERKY